MTEVNTVEDTISRQAASASHVVRTVHTGATKRNAPFVLILIAVLFFSLSGLAAAEAGGKAGFIVEPLYPSHNDIRAHRLNIVFIGSEYENFSTFKKIACDIIALNHENRLGLLQLRPFSEPSVKRCFNFWICRTIGKSGKPYREYRNNGEWEITSLLFNDAVQDLNRHYGTSLVRGGRKVMGVLLVNANPQNIPGYGYGDGSFGRDLTFTVWDAKNPWFSHDDMVVTHVHELVHSIPELYDETSGSGTAYDNPEWKSFDYRDQFFVPGSNSDRGGITKEKFLRLGDREKEEYVKKNVPWKAYIGKGDGTLKVGIYEGGLGKSRYIYRSTKNSLMNYPYGLKPGSTLGFGVWVENVIRTRILREFGS